MRETLHSRKVSLFISIITPWLGGCKQGCKWRGVNPRQYAGAWVEPEDRCRKE